MAFLAVENPYTERIMAKITKQIAFNNSLKELAEEAAVEIYHEAYDLVSDKMYKEAILDREAFEVAPFEKYEEEEFPLEGNKVFATAIDDFVRHLANELHSIRLENNTQHYG